jgi:hypothetical protein
VHLGIDHTAKAGGSSSSTSPQQTPAVPPWQPTPSAIPSRVQYQLRLLPGACLRRAPRCSWAGAAEQPSAASAKQHCPSWPLGPCAWCKTATPAVLAVVYACAELLRGAGAARDGGRSALNGRAARNRFRGPPPTRAPGRSMPVQPLCMLGRVQGSRWTAAETWAGPGCPVGHSGAGRCCSSFKARGVT